jgi:tRNA threonylcarbamoyladenosine biosynthesis protein TsaB
MILLALDTTGPNGSVALIEDRRLLAEAGFEAQLNHSEKLLASLDHLLKNAGRDIREVTGFAAAAGPGSFTGIRIGLATVKALALASGVRVAAVSGLEALALKLREEHDHGRLLCPMIDAKKGEVYAALFRAGGDGLAEILPQAAWMPDDFLTRLPAKSVIHFIGTGVEAYGEKIRSRLGDAALFPRRSLFIAPEVGFLGLALLQAGKGVPAPDVRPLYFRRSQAEERH